MANHLDTGLRVVAVNAQQQLVVRQQLAAVLLADGDFAVGGHPGVDDGVVVLVVVDGDGVVDQVADAAESLVHGLLLDGGGVEQVLLLLLNGDLLLEEVVGVLLGLLFRADLLLCRLVGYG